jgi:hypothetical protein
MRMKYEHTDFHLVFNEVGLFSIDRSGFFAADMCAG